LLRVGRPVNSDRQDLPTAQQIGDWNLRPPSAAAGPRLALLEGMISMNAAVSPYAALGQSPAASKPQSPAEAAAAKSQAEVADFETYANMTPAQRMQANVMASMGITQQDLNNMTPTQRAAVEQKIEKAAQDTAMQAAQQKAAKGQLADVTA
jgi:hypothetical protein